MLLSTATDPISVIIMLAVGTVAALLGLIFINLWFQDVRKARATRSWPTTTGHILKSKVESRRGWSRANNKNITVYDPLVVYEYTVNEVRYQSQQINIGGRFATQTRNDVARKIVPYPSGATVQVFYDPADPQQAVLEHGVSTGVALLVIGLFILLLPIILLFPWNRIV